MKLIVGLGNPGRRYTYTRHNLGFQVLDRLRKNLNINKARKQYQAEISYGKIANIEIMCIKPLTYMNNSGIVVSKVMQATNESLENLLIICDDFQLPFGKLRIRPRGSSGGHKGLESIIQHLRTNQIPRLRIGIGRPANSDAVDFVLGKFSRLEKEKLKPVMEKAIEAIILWCTEGIEEVMNKFN